MISLGRRPRTLISVLSVALVWNFATTELGSAQTFSIRVAESCPKDADAVGSTGNAYAVTVIEQNLGMVRVYGESQPDTYVGHRAEWTSPETVGTNGIVVIAFTADLQRHAEALVKLVKNPEAVVVCHGRFSERERQQLETDVRAKAPLGAVSQDFDGVSVRLRGVQANIAEKLFTEYGESLNIVVGNLHYPSGSATGTCGVIPVIVSPRLLTLKKGTVVRSSVGQDVSADVLMETRSKTRVNYFGGVEAVISFVGSNVVVARTSLPVDALGIFGSARRGHPGHLRIRASVESCVSGLGWVLPAGRYEIHYLAAVATGNNTRFNSVPNVSLPPIPLIISDALIVRT
jgi:hypothetical protein